MNFISFEFAVFLALVALGVVLLPARGRVWLLLAASLYYALGAGPATLGVLLLCVALAWAAGRALARWQGNARKLALWLALAALLGLLGLFKYATFASNILAELGLTLHLPQLALPLGISFFTFQLIGYLLDVYHRRLPAESSLPRLTLFAALFPKLLAGPIERGAALLPQLAAPARPAPERLTRGLQLILWGLFLKLVLADRLATWVAPVFAAGAAFSSLETLVALYLYSFQIYFDFAAYSLLAIGGGRLLGIELTQNFRRPYLAASIQEFWARWHISLTTWLRDYLYLPAVRRRLARSSNRASLKLWDYQILLVFLASGLWHGAGWTFIVWGGLHGLLHVVSNWRPAALRPLPRGVGALLTFHIVTFAWVFFRAESLTEALRLLAQVARLQGGFTLAAFAGLPLTQLVVLGALAIVLAVEITLERRGLTEVDDLLPLLPGWLRWSAYYGLALTILVFGVLERSDFIYFQF